MGQRRGRRPAVHAVVMAGGAGTRFWPLSREKRPKPLLAVGGGQTLLGDTVARARRVATGDRVWLVCGAPHAGEMRRVAGLPRRRVLVEPAMPSIILDAAAAAGVMPQHIMIELTESTAAQHRIEDVIESVARFRLKDFRVAIDDFGTGQSTLERLQRIPFTDLKVDRSFVTGAASDDDKRGIIEYSVQLAHRLGLNVIAEGVETAADQEEVRRLGCEMAQGYYYTRPLPLAQVDSWLQQWIPRVPLKASRN